MSFPFKVNILVMLPLCVFVHSQIIMVIITRHLVNSYSIKLVELGLMSTHQFWFQEGGGGFFKRKGGGAIYL